MPLVTPVAALGSANAMTIDLFCWQAKSGTDSNNTPGVLGRSILPGTGVYLQLKKLEIHTDVI
jgi:hypothetical protein